MPPNQNFVNQKIRNFRQALARVDALPQLSLLAVIVGVMVGLLIVAFRIALESAHLFLPMDSAEGFESLSPSLRIVVILSGTLVIAITLQTLDKYKRQMSVSHVIDRLHNHQGNMPGANIIAQFILATVAVWSGQSVGREGPAVHLGAGTASKIGQWMRLPNNSMQTVLACGIAAAISASFDTPLAGVIFAMEVVLMEYTIVSFVPVILSSVIGAAICKGILGSSVIFNVDVASISSLLELGFIVTAGLAIAISAGVFIKLNLLTLKYAKQSIALRISAAGILTAAVAVFVPEIMGLGYDTIQATLNGEILVGALIVITLAKLLVTPIVIGLGTPGGLIGPSLFVGACSGFLLGALAQTLFPNLNINLSVYVLLGMTGMMAAVMNAPLAALVAVLELSNTANIIFPAMLMIVVACIATRQLFGVRGIFVEQLCQSGKDLEVGPAARALRRVGVLSIMNRHFIIADEIITKENAQYILTRQPQWIVFSHEDRLFGLVASDLAHFLDNLPEALQTDDAEIRLSEVPGRRHMLQAVLERESLYDAFVAMRKTSCKVIYVTSNVHSHRSIHGLITLEAIQNHYQPKEITSALD